MDDIEKVAQVIDLIAASLCKPRFGRLFAYPAEVSEAIKLAIADQAIRAHILQSAWRPIGEAPKDGSTIIVRSGNWIVTAHWHRHQQCWASCGPSYDRLPADEQPTDWQPIPPLPLPPTGGDDKMSEKHTMCANDAANRCPQCGTINNEVIDLRERLAASERALAEAQAQIEVGLQISGSFFEALKPLKLTHIYVENPGLHVTALIAELAKLRAPVGEPFKHAFTCAVSIHGQCDAVKLEYAEQLARTIRERDARIALLEADLGVCKDFARQYSAMFAKLNHDDIAALNATLRMVRSVGQIDAATLGDELARVRAECGVRQIQGYADGRTDRAELLQRWLDFHTAEAGMTAAIVCNRDRFDEFMKQVNSREQDLIADAKAALSISKRGRA